MGNEMGNNNSSGLQEEVYTNNTGDQGRSLQEDVHGDGGAVGESKDNHEKETGLDSDVLVNQIFDEKEKEETEVHHPAGSGSPEVEVKSNDEAGGVTTEILPTSLSEDSKGHEKSLESILEENLSKLNDLQLQKQTSIKKDDEERNYTKFDTKSLSNDPEPAELEDSNFDQPDKLAEIQANTSVQESYGLPLEGSILKNTGESSATVLGVTGEVEIKWDDLSVEEMAAKEEEMACEERWEIEGDMIGNDFGQNIIMTSESPSGAEIKCNGDLSTEINPIRSVSPRAESEAISTDKSLSSHLEVSESIDNCVDFTAEAILIGKESENGEDKPDPCPAPSYDNVNVSQPESVMIESECENSYKRDADYTCSDSGSNSDCIEEANVSPKPVNEEKRATDHASSDPGISKDSIEEANLSQSELVMIEPETENDGTRATDFTFCNSGVNCVEEAKAAENGHLIDLYMNDQDEASTEQHKGSTEEDVVVPESGVVCENSDKRDTDYTCSDSGSNSDCIEAANVSPKPVNDEKRATDYASSDPGISKDSIEEANLSQSELVIIEPESENDGTRATDFTFCNSGVKNCVEEAKAAENDHLIDVYMIDQDEASTEQHKGSTEEDVVVPESGVVLSESSLEDCETEEALEETKIVEERERNEASYDIGNNTEVRQSGNQCNPPTLPEEETEAFFPKLKQENCGELLVTEVSSFDSTNLMAETLLSVAELTNEKSGQEKSAVRVAESNPPPANNFSGQCAKDHKTPAFASESYQAQESVGRHITGSNPSNTNIQAQMQRSPSFGLNLQIEAKSEESDRTPLLYQDKTAIEHTQNGQDTLKYQTMPVEEKMVRMERSDSEKSKTLLITPQKQDSNTAAKKGNKEVTSTSSLKSKEKKPRSSLFTNCMCCTTVIN